MGTMRAAPSGDGGLAAHVAGVQRVCGPGFLSMGSGTDLDIALGQLSIEGKVGVDLGCGMGGYAIELARRGMRRVWALDVSAPMCEWASAHVAGSGQAHRVGVERIEPERPWPLETGSVDLILMKSVLMFVAPSARDTVFAEAARVLAPGGVLVIDGAFRAPVASPDALQRFLQGEGWFSEAYLETLREVLQRLEAQTLRCRWVDTTSHKLALVRAGSGRLLRPALREALAPCVYDWLTERWAASERAMAAGEIHTGVVYARKRRAHSLPGGGPLRAS